MSVSLSIYPNCRSSLSQACPLLKQVFEELEQKTRHAIRKPVLAVRHHLPSVAGVGDPIEDELCREKVHVDGYKFTNATKKDLIENLSIMIENHQLTIPADSSVD